MDTEDHAHIKNQASRNPEHKNKTKKMAPNHQGWGKRTRILETLNTKTKRKRILQTSKGEANEAGFSSKIIYYIFTKHPTTLNVVSRATYPEQEVIGPVKNREQRGLDKKDWEF